MAEFKVRRKRRESDARCVADGCPWPTTHEVTESGVVIARGCEWHAYRWARQVRSHHDIPRASVIDPAKYPLGKPIPYRYATWDKRKP